MSEREAFSDREIEKPEWLLVPPEEGDFKLMVSVGEGTELPGDVQDALDQLVRTVEEHDFIASEDVEAAICVGRGTPCHGRCAGFCGGKCSGNCFIRFHAVEEGLVKKTEES